MALQHLSRSQKAMQIERRTSRQWSVAHIGINVPSQSKPNTTYTTTCDSCSCPDAFYRGVTCKHQLAARLFLGRQAA